MWQGLAEMSVTQLTKKQAKALGAMLNCPSIAAAAKACGLGERTLFRYLTDPVFIACYEDARRAQVGHAVAHLQRMTTTAAVVLEEIMTDPLARSASKIAAARVVLDLIVRSTQSGEASEPGPPMPQPPKLDLSVLDDEEFVWFRRIRKKLSGSGQAIGTTSV